jgi:hypothetical protein
MKANRDFEINWNIIKDWNESFRYESTISESKARNLIMACVKRKTGILPWVRKKW